MDTNINIPLNYVIISIFFGYLYFYLADVGYRDILSLTSVKLGCISGFILSTLAVLIGLLEANAFTLNEFIESSIFIGILGMIMGVVLVMIGGLFAVTVKNILRKCKW
jgi:hypothetical protein